MHVDPRAPHRVVSFEIDPIPAPDELQSAEVRRLGSGPLDDMTRRALIDWMAREVEMHYVVPDVGRQMIAELREHAIRGDYDRITDGNEFAQTVERDMREVSHDLHLIVFYGRPFA